jgi:hypothetical protein
MSIQFMFHGYVYCLQFGHRTPWFASIPFITFTRLYYDGKYEVWYGEMLYKSSF